MCMLTEACVEWISAEVIALFRAAADVAAMLRQMADNGFLEP